MLKEGDEGNKNLRGSLILPQTQPCVRRQCGLMRTQGTSPEATLEQFGPVPPSCTNHQDLRLKRLDFVSYLCFEKAPYPNTGLWNPGIHPHSWNAFPTSAGTGHITQRWIRYLVATHPSLPPAPLSWLERGPSPLPCPSGGILSVAPDMSITTVLPPKRPQAPGGHRRQCPPSPYILNTQCNTHHK